MSYQIVYDDIYIDIALDYNSKKCFQIEDKPCQKDVLLKAVSFLKDIKEVPQKIEMKIEFEGGGVVTIDLNLSDFNLATIERLFKRIS